MPTVDLGYEPREHQRELHVLADRQRFVVAVCHRRFGKTVALLRHAIDEALRCPLAAPRVAYIAPFRDQAKSVAWDYLKRFTRPLADAGMASYNESELRCDIAGDRRIRLFGADNYNALRGQYLDFAVLDEVGQMAPAVWEEVVRPMLSDRKGRAVFIGTPAGRNFFWRTFEYARLSNDAEWAAVTYKASQTGVIDAAELESARRTMGADRFAQEYECSFEAAIRGAYYATELKDAREGGRITRLPVEKLPVSMAWDLGIGDDTAIWLFQDVGREVRVLHYYSNNGVGLDHYASYLEAWRIKNRIPSWGDIIVPHDAEVRELGTGRARVEVMREMFGKMPKVLPRFSVDDGIQAVRKEFARMWFDERECASGLDSLAQYRREFDEKRETFHDRPLHDWASHGADAMRYLALGLRRGPAGAKRAPINYPALGIV